MFAIISLNHDLWSNLLKKIETTAYFYFPAEEESECIRNVTLQIKSVCLTINLAVHQINVRLSPSKKKKIFASMTAFQNVEKYFLFHLKSFFRSQDI